MCLEVSDLFLEIMVVKIFLNKVHSFLDLFLGGLSVVKHFGVS